VKNDRILLEKLIAETSSDVITWIKADKPDYGYASQYFKWKGEKKITEQKSVAFILQHHVDDYRICELKVFLLNKSLQTRDLIYEITPGLFNFKIKMLIEDLIYLLEEKNKKEIIGPLQKDWDEVVY
jgi:hypothetical protein